MVHVTVIITNMTNEHVEAMVGEYPSGPGGCKT
jgi:hypothetical protein